MSRKSKKSESLFGRAENLQNRLLLEAERIKELRECGNADHLIDEDGYFKSDMPYGDGSYSIGYLEDLCQFLYYNDSLTDSERLEKILGIEGVIQNLLGELRYVPYWSTKF